MSFSKNLVFPETPTPTPTLPPELLIQILLALPIADIHTCRRVNRHWKQLAEYVLVQRIQHFSLPYILKHTGVRQEYPESQRDCPAHCTNTKYWTITTTWQQSGLTGVYRNIGRQTIHIYSPHLRCCIFKSQTVHSQECFWDCSHRNIVVVDNYRNPITIFNFIIPHHPRMYTYALSLGEIMCVSIDVNLVAPNGRCIYFPSTKQVLTQSGTTTDILLPEEIETAHTAHSWRKEQTLVIYVQGFPDIIYDFK